MAPQRAVTQASPFFKQPNQGQGPLTSYANPSRVMVAGNKVYAPRIQSIAEGLNAPFANWNITVLDGNQWEDWAKRNPNASKTDGAFSLLGSGRTFVSQDWLGKHSDEHLRNNLAHELGHLVSNSPNEQVAEQTKAGYFKNQSWTAPNGRK